MVLKLYCSLKIIEKEVEVGSFKKLIYQNLLFQLIFYFVIVLRINVWNGFAKLQILDLLSVKYKQKIASLNHCLGKDLKANK